MEIEFPDNIHIHAFRRIILILCNRTFFVAHLILLSNALLVGIRVFSRKVVANVHKLGLLRKTFCSKAVPQVSTPAPSKPTKDSEENHGLNNNASSHDIAIVGGGMVGMALACSLASMPLTKQLNIAIVDSNPALGSASSIKKEGPPDPRVSTVTPATISLFKDVGAWQYVQQQRHAYFDKMQVWDYTGLGYTRYNARDVDKEVLGCVVENKVLQGSLLSCLQEKDSQKTIYPSRVISMSYQSTLSHGEGSASPGTKSQSHQSMVKLDLSNGSSLFAKLVVGADGSKSLVRDLAGIKTTGWNYSQNAIICTVEHTVENHCAWQRFLPTGPLALLPIGDKYSNIVWTMSPKESSDRQSVTEDDFIYAVNHALDYGYGPHPRPGSLGIGDIFSWFGAGMKLSSGEHFEVPPKVVKLASERMVFPLSLKHANSYASKRVVLIGDAAHTVHPLAGQGVNLGFGDASALARVIAEAVAVGTDIGEISMLKKYEAERKSANIMMMAILDGFQKAYSVDFGPLNIVRAAAFNGANYFPLLKRSIISYASGEQKLPLFS
ncbi:FAD-binding domain [Dillenia turbinata]|uniref:Ubiquinone biosynthesis monooxygenase COQ6, mitochondrial n=1 Tax=Dillenia turbinata TaxID=194707 RepID=A0AAN8Z9F4_9MAGN